MGGATTHGVIDTPYLPTGGPRILGMMTPIASLCDVPLVSATGCASSTAPHTSTAVLATTTHGAELSGYGSGHKIHRQRAALQPASRRRSRERVGSNLCQRGATPCPGESSGEDHMLGLHGNG